MVIDPRKGEAIHRLTQGCGAIDSDGNCIMRDGSAPPSDKQIALEVQRIKEGINKAALVKARIEKLKNWIAYNQDYEERELVPIAEKLAARAYNADQSLPRQRKAFAAAKAEALKKLRTANAKGVKLATASAAKYKAELQIKEKELKKLEG